MQEELCHPISQDTPYNDIRRIMKAQVDSGPADDAGNDKEKNPVTGEPISQQGSHHKSAEGVDAGEGRVHNFEFCPLPKRERRSLPLNKKFQTICDCRLYGIKEGKSVEDSGSMGQKPAGHKKEEDCNSTTEVGQPGQDSIEKGQRPPLTRPLHKFQLPGHPPK